ncbi:hypothetical protein F4561_003411 [Lipingzhangella halophila]|uniref:DUF4031 domain-containing protein n=1 Tax=Lipingzhangella halophila TaxID=1783352 RepID=A0A7W7RJH0_9ACTN|nr:DUF4031 domain-containing protein [Lipingzhangella halophila]MBB4932591.1 hypothetical protein [Lipingzhangella halophila]
MSILIDPPLWPGPRGLYWSHLVSDLGQDELHAFARRLGVPARAFDRDHYDVPETAYDRAVELGALAVPSRELVSRLVASGLRRRRPRRALLQPEQLRTGVDPRPVLPAGAADGGVEKLGRLQ